MSAAVIGDVLLAIGANPPAQTSGERTLARIAQARDLLGFQQVRIANLFALPSYRTSGLSELGSVAEGWLQARLQLEDEVSKADGILLAYGKSEPTGPARMHFRDQVSWLDLQIANHILPVWWVGGAARHPSRWQRYTCRTYPDLPYEAALPLALQSREPASQSEAPPLGRILDHR